MRGMWLSEAKAVRPSGNADAGFRYGSASRQRRAHQALDELDPAQPMNDAERYELTVFTFG
jgi:hypothetical protein